MQCKGSAIHKLRVWLQAAKTVHAVGFVLCSSEFGIASDMGDGSPVMLAPWRAVVGAEAGTVYYLTCYHDSSLLLKAETFSPPEVGLRVDGLYSSYQQQRFPHLNVHV